VLHHGGFTTSDVAAAFFEDAKSALQLEMM
jgi:hypothetical protein